MVVPDLRTEEAAGALQETETLVDVLRDESLCVEVSELTEVVNFGRRWERFHAVDHHMRD